MKKSLATWRLISECLATGHPVALLYVVQSSGSSPGRQGFFMAVALDGRMEGSIGGGIMEHKLVELVKAQLQHSNGTINEGVLLEQIHDKSAVKNQSGMICSGRQTNFLYRVKEEDNSTIQQIIACLQQNKAATLVLSPRGIRFVNQEPSAAFSFEEKKNETWIYKERLGYQNHLYIVGGGHCALALSKLMASLDFYIHLFDDRAELVTMNQNDSVHEKKLVSDYSELSNLIPSGENNYVVVITFGYRTDDIAIRALLQKDFKYFGVLGSKAKIQKLLKVYREEGLNESRLQKLYAPIGLPIKSETPEEIAISIAAQIIQVKNESKTICTTNE